MCDLCGKDEDKLGRFKGLLYARETAQEKLALPAEWYTSHSYMIHFL